jgi:protein subunit release factor B
MKERKLLFSLSKDKGDFRVQPYRGTGNGGQKKNKTMSACRIYHDASGTVVQSEEERSFFQNRKIAFKRLLNTEKFKQWHKIETAKKLGRFVDIEEYVEDQMRPEHIKVEEKIDGKWIEILETMKNFKLAPYPEVKKNLEERALETAKILTEKSK